MKGEVKHTPGPWETTLDGRGDPLCITAVGRTDLAMVEMLYGDDAHIEAEANARLIAAAPDLLEALKSALEIVLECDPDTVRMYAPRIKSAIAKAEGRKETQ